MAWPALASLARPPHCTRGRKKLHEQREARGAKRSSARRHHVHVERLDEPSTPRVSVRCALFRRRGTGEGGVQTGSHRLPQSDRRPGSSERGRHGHDRLPQPRRPPAIVPREQPPTSYSTQRAVIADGEGGGSPINGSYRSHRPVSRTSVACTATRRHVLCGLHDSMGAIPRQAGRRVDTFKYP